MKPRPGQVLGSTVDSTTVIDLTCAGVERWDPTGGGTGPAGEADSAQLTGTQMGELYADEAVGLELLCTKPGKEALAVNGLPLAQLGPKTLSASD